MMENIELKFDNDAVHTVVNLVEEAGAKLLLISPYIILNDRMKSALSKHLTNPTFRLSVLVGKGESGDLYSCINQDSLEFLKTFPNVEIRSSHRVHAKIYCNDFDYFITSMNLHDYSMANNFEAGVLVRYSSRGLFAPIDHAIGTVVESFWNTLRKTVGRTVPVDSVRRFRILFRRSTLLYKTEPLLPERELKKRLFGNPKNTGFKVVEDHLPQADYRGKVCANTLASQLKKTQQVIREAMEAHGYVLGDQITTKGMREGLLIRDGQNGPCIVYPQSLALAVCADVAVQA